MRYVHVCVCYSSKWNQRSRKAKHSRKIINFNKNQVMPHMYMYVIIRSRSSAFFILSWFGYGMKTLKCTGEIGLQWLPPITEWNNQRSVPVRNIQHNLVWHDKSRKIILWNEWSPRQCPCSTPDPGIWVSCKWLGLRRWFSPGTPVSSTTYNWLITA